MQRLKSTGERQQALTLTLVHLFPLWDILNLATLPSQATGGKPSETKRALGFSRSKIKSLSLMDENRRAHMCAGAGYSSGVAASFTVNL